MSFHKNLEICDGSTAGKIALSPEIVDFFITIVHLV